MDTAFINRTGFTSGWAYAEANFYPPDNENAWIKRIAPFTWNKLGFDRIQDGSEHFNLVGVRMNFTRQGFLRFHHGWGHEPWARRRFRSDRSLLTGNVQILRWLSVNGNVNWGWATFYDPVSPFQGRSISRSAGVTFQPNTRLNQAVSYSTVRFTRAANQELVFTAHIANLRTTYQFNPRLFARAIAQYDSARRRILTDFLASYETVPGTVFHAGYGALLERREIRDGVLAPGTGEFITVNRGLFLKASYVYRF